MELPAESSALALRRRDWGPSAIEAAPAGTILGRPVTPSEGGQNRSDPWAGAALVAQLGELLYRQASESPPVLSLVHGFALGAALATLRRDAFEVPSAAWESVPVRGDAALARLPRHLRAGLEDQHVAITPDGRILAQAPSLTELNRILAALPPVEDYFVTQVGKESLLTIG